MYRIAGIAGATVLVCGEAAHADVSGDLLEAFKAHCSIESVAVVIVTPGPVVRRVGKVLDAHQNNQADETFDLVGGDRNPVKAGVAEETASFGVGIGLTGDQLNECCREDQAEVVDGVAALGQEVVRAAVLREGADGRVGIINPCWLFPTIC